MLFWPWASSESDAPENSEETTPLPLIISLVGRFSRTAGVRYDRYKYEMYSNYGVGGDMLCASLRSSVGLAVAGHKVWAVNHLYGPLPTSYKWGYYRSEVSCVFCTWVDRAHIARLRAGTRFVSSTQPCRAVAALTDFRLHTAAAWLTLRKCFHEHLGDPHKPPRGRNTDVMLDAGSGLRNVVLWDVAFLAFAQPTSHNSTTRSVSMRLWAHLARYADPNGPPRRGPHHGVRPTEHATTWYADGLAQRLTLWYNAQPYAEPYALRPYALQQKLRGCNVLALRDAAALPIQPNLTLPAAPQRQAGIALGNWVLADARAAGRGAHGLAAGLHDGPPRCGGRERLARAAAAEVTETRCAARRASHGDARCCP